MRSPPMTLQAYARPLLSLIDMWEVKAALGTASAAMLAILERLFAVNLDLVVLLVLLVVVDLVTGIVASKRRGEKVRSKLMRATIIKVIEYAVFCGVAVAIGNGAETIPIVGAVLIHLGEVAIIFIGLTEFVSITENLTSANPRLGVAFRGLASYLRKQSSIAADAIEEPEGSYTAGEHTRPLDRPRQDFALGPSGTDPFAPAPTASDPFAPDPFAPRR